MGDETASIIIPTYYRNELLKEAIESALDQEYEPTEVIVVDDSGERHAAATVNAYDDVSYVPLSQNVGENPARDAALDVASGKYVQFLDDDDLLRPDKIRLQQAKIDDETGVIYSGLKYHESGTEIMPEPHVRGDVLERALEFGMWPPCFTTAMLMDREILERIRPLEFHGAGDTTFMIGLAQHTNFDYVAEPLVEKRLDVDSLGYSLENIRNKKQLFEKYDSLYAQYPDAYRTARARVHTEEGHVRLTEVRWSPRATLAFARAAYYDSENRGLCLSKALGSVGGQRGLQSAMLATQFLSTARADGLSQAFAKTTQYLRSN